MLQVLITDFGPTREICPAKLEACMLVESVAADCFIAPCNHSSLFGEDTVHQPTWSEPSKDALAAKLMKIYAIRRSTFATQDAVADQIFEHLRQRTWYRTGTLMLQRIEALLKG